MSISPHIAVVTNISPNHLDVHKSYVEYIDAKANIFLHQKASEGDFAVFNYNNALTNEYVGKAPCGHVFFNSAKALERGAYIRDNKLVYNDGKEVHEIIPLDEILLPGKHNIENYLAAICAVFSYVKIDDIAHVARTFGGVEHRLELVRNLNEVKYYNSSIDSSPSRTIAALGTFAKKVILIAGGKDKGIPYDELGPHLIDKVKTLILIGATSGKIARSLMDAVNTRGIENPVKIVYCKSYEEAVTTARDNATEGDCVILSPASTSFDMFNNFEERGKTYKKLVMELS
jgi:UDP-N-acetylmuramoylalanine--D-glutamate ligase